MWFGLGFMWIGLGLGLGLGLAADTNGVSAGGVVIVDVHVPFLCSLHVAFIQIFPRLSSHCYCHVSYYGC